MAQFLNDHNVKNLESEKPVLKVKRNPCIDLLLTNSLSSFQGTMTVTAGLSDLSAGLSNMHHVKRTF